MIENVLRLMQQSAFHRAYTVETILRCIQPPLNLAQHISVIRDGQMVAWASWAWMAPDRAQAFLLGQYKLQPSDWCAGEHLVFMDFIAPHGHAMALYGQLRRAFKGIPVHDVPSAVWVRFAKGNKIVSVKNGK